MADQACSCKASGWWKIVVVAVLALVVVLVVVTKKRTPASSGGDVITHFSPLPGQPVEGAVWPVIDPLTTALASGKPVLADFGKGTCAPCKMMKPILDKLAEELQGKVHVLILDTGDDALIANEYDVRMIPTQIFFAGTGKELFRHVGFMPREDILAKMNELGMIAK